MGVILELVRARQKIAELEAERIKSLNRIVELETKIANSSTPTPPITDFELPSPGYWLKPEIINNLKITKDSLIVLLDEDPKVWRTTVADTNSMDTFLDYRHTVVLIAGANEKDHERILDAVIPGDIIIYEVPGQTIMHAVKTIAIDSVNGRTWPTQGLNPLITWIDPYLLTDTNIKWVAILVAYTDRI